MARLRYVDVQGTIGAGGLSNSATSHTVTTPLTYANGALVPSITGTDFFLLSVLTGAGLVREVIKVTAYNFSTGAMTIARAQEGTTASTHSSGDKVTLSTYPSDFVAGAVTWTQVVNDPMTSNTQWTVQAGTWTFGGTGVTNSSAGSDDWLRLTAGISTSLRAIQATVKVTSGSKLGFGFTSNGGWGSGGLGACIDPGNDVLWYDRYGSGGSQIAWAGNYSQDYTFLVLERQLQSQFMFYVDGVMLYSFNPALVNQGGIGLYSRGGGGVIKDVKIWTGVDNFSPPS